MDALTNLNIDMHVEIAHEELVRKIDNLVASLSHWSARLKSDPNTNINELGIIQGEAISIDTACARLATFRKVKRLLNGEAF